jgi:hypothetical protein
MATFDLTADQNWQDAAFSTRAGGDTYNLSGYTLTIDTDTRYCTNSNATKGAMGPVNDSSSLGGVLYIDGTKVRIIPYDTGSGNVPAIGTSITQGGVSGYLLGVWSALNVAPTAAAAAMPASGWIKIKNKTGGDYAAGALGGISANATGADVVGWIEVAAPIPQTLTFGRKGTFRILGEWYAAGLTSGSTAQTIQLPASLAYTYYPGVWIENGDLIGAIANDGGVETFELNATRDATTTGDVTLLPTTPAANDAYYFGFGTTFSSMDILQSTAGNGVWTITWEYWDGSAWTALAGVSDGTSGFIGSTGALTVSWTLPGDWAESTLYERTAYWVRARVSSYTSVVAAPKATRVCVLNSGVYEFYPNDSGNTSIRQDIGGKVVWISTQGLVTINNSGSGADGFLPNRNLRVRVPNVVTVNSSGATNTALPAGTNYYRCQTNTEPGGNIDITRANLCWWVWAVYAYSISIVDTAICDNFEINAPATSPVITNVGVGIGYRTLSTTYSSCVLKACNTGGTITNCVFMKSRAPNGWESNVSIADTVCSDTSKFNLINCTFRFGLMRSSVHPVVETLRSENIVFTNCSFIGGHAYLSDSADISFINIGSLDAVNGTTTDYDDSFVFRLNMDDNVVINGLHFKDVPNSNPYASIVYSDYNYDGSLSVYNLGTPAHPLSFGPSATYGTQHILQGATQDYYTNFSVKRCYITDVRLNTSSWMGDTNAVTNIGVESSFLVIENVFISASADNVQRISCPNSRVKGLQSTFWSLYDYAGVIGTQFYELFTPGSTTAGDLLLRCCEKTGFEPSASSYTVVTGGTGFGFAGVVWGSTNARLYAPNVDDEVIWTWPWYTLGHQRFASGECTTAGEALVTNPNNHDFWYDLDTGAGFSGVWKNLKYTRTGGATTNTSATITMTSTTGVSVGDFVYGTNIPTNTIIIAVDDGATCTMSQAATGTGSSYTFRFNHSPLVGHVEVTLAAGGYVNAVAGDIGKVVSYSGGTPTDTGTLLAYDNTNRKWWITTTTDYTWSNTATALVIASGTGTGTPSVAGTVEAVLPTTGFKLQIRMKTIVAATDNQITRLDLPTITNTTFRALQYPLISESVNINIYAVTEANIAIQDVQVAVYKTSNLTNLMNEDTDVTGLASAVFDYIGTDTPVIIRLRKNSPAGTRYRNYDTVGTITSTGLTVTCVMQLDEVAT